MRLNADGSLDASFNPNPNSTVSTIAIQSNGQILVGGAFTSFVSPNGGTTVNITSLARLNSSGTVDTTYNPNPNAPVSVIVLQSNGQAVVGGSFASMQPNAGTAVFNRFNIARVNTDGSIDANFNPNPLGAVDAIALQSNGQIVIGGAFTSLQPNATGNSIIRNFAARLNNDGTLDTGFDPEPNAQVNAVAIQSNGQVVLGGSFTTLQPLHDATITNRNGKAREKSDGSLEPD